jgi:uncharacterized protein
VEFDQFTVTLLLANPDYTPGTQAEEDALQDAHLAHLADLHAAGHLYAAGPLGAGPDRLYRGLSILGVDPATALALKSADPAVRAGRFTIEVMPWMVPAGAIHATPTRFPRSIADARG